MTRYIYMTHMTHYIKWLIWTDIFMTHDLLHLWFTRFVIFIWLALLTTFLWLTYFAIFIWLSWPTTYIWLTRYTIFANTWFAYIYRLQDSLTGINVISQTDNHTRFAYIYRLHDSLTGINVSHQLTISLDLLICPGYRNHTWVLMWVTNWQSHLICLYVQVTGITHGY